MSYLHLAPSLRHLVGHSLQVWGDAAVRRDAINDVMICWTDGRVVDLTQALARVDQAIRDGLTTVGLPISPDVPRHYQVVAGWQSYFARIGPEGLVLAGDMLRPLLERDEHDRVFRTLVHEGIHNRQLRSMAATSERGFRGYEEGLAEGLARYVVHGQAAIPPLPGSFDYYVAVYETLAETLGMSADVLLRLVWTAVPGAVRRTLPTVVSVVMSQPQAGGTLLEERGERLQVMADHLFSNARLGAVPDTAVLRRLWRQVLP